MTQRRRRFELERSSSGYAPDPGSGAPGVRKFESCIVHHLVPEAVKVSGAFYISPHAYSFLTD